MRVRILDGKKIGCDQPWDGYVRERFIGTTWTVESKFFARDKGWLLEDNSYWWHENWLEVVDDTPEEKFRPGMVVRVKKPTPRSDGISTWVSEMDRLDGEYVSLTERDTYSPDYWYCAGEPYMFQESWLEPVDD